MCGSRCCGLVYVVESAAYKFCAKSISELESETGFGGSDLCVEDRIKAYKRAHDVNYKDSRCSNLTDLVWNFDATMQCRSRDATVI